VGDNTAGFWIGAYDTSQVLVIDPTVEPATYVGGLGADQAFAIALGADGSVFVTGNTTSTNFPTTLGSFAAIAPGGVDAFVVRLKADFTTAVYSTFLGGSGDDAGRSLAVDTVGIAGGDRIVAINGYPPAGGAFASFLLMQRDPDRNTVTVHLDRRGVRMERVIVVR
jgi:hypothetical protein